jgi:hypothetical protein
VGRYKGEETRYKEDIRKKQKIRNQKITMYQISLAT